MPKYKFRDWEDGSTNPARQINLNANMQITANYVLVTEMSYKPSASLIGIAKIRRKTTPTLVPLTVDEEEGTTTTFTGKLSEATGPNMGKGIPNKTIHFLVGDTEKATAITDADGNFSFDYTWADMGEYEFQVTYLGD